MKIALVYTSTTPELIATVEEELRLCLGSAAELIHYEDASILAETRESGFVTANAAARLMGMFASAVNAGADAILNCCSSVGEVADCAQGFARYTGVPIVRIDEEMCREAARIGSRIGILATLPTTMEPTRNTILRVTREIGRKVSLVDGLLDGAFGLSQEEFKGRLIAKAREMAPHADCILLAQGSMAYCEQDVEKVCGIPVLSSPRFGAKALRAALEAKGLL